MQEVYGELFSTEFEDKWRCVLTNGEIKINGENIMGGGIARQVSEAYPWFPAELGEKLKLFGNQVFIFPDIKWFSFPTKDKVRFRSDIMLIRNSCEQLCNLLDTFDINEVYLPRPGCGLGGLTWEQVKPRIEGLLDDRVNIITWK